MSPLVIDDCLHFLYVKKIYYPVRFVFLQKSLSEQANSLAA